MEMESPVSFELKEEPASPLWELELLDEVGEIWEGDVEVIDGDVDVDVEVDNNAFWGQQDISELIGKEEQILGLELDEIFLEDQDVKEEPFNSWLDSGAIYDGPNSTVSGLPTFNTQSLWSAPESPSDEKTTVFTAPAGGPAAPGDPLQGATADLFTEFENVLSQAGVQGSLTPPDSPRSAYGAQQALLQLAPNLQPLQLSPASGQRFIVLQDMANSPAMNDELDELMAETYQKNGGTSISSSPSSTISSIDTKSKGRPWDSPSASSSGCSDSGYDDPEWSPVKSTESPDSSDGPSQAKKRCLTSTEERRLRKKEQNKNAATRYRMKKKMEMEEIIGEEKELLDRHDTLKSEVVEITREIKYLKGLMGDLFRAKGLIRAK